MTEDKFASEKIKVGKSQCDICLKQKDGICTEYKKIPKEVADGKKKCRKLRVWE